MCRNISVALCYTDKDILMKIGFIGLGRMGAAWRLIC